LFRQQKFKKEVCEKATRNFVPQPNSPEFEKESQMRVDLEI